MVFGSGASEVVVTAPFRTGPEGTLVLASGESTSTGGFYSGPSGRTQELLVSTDSGFGVGRRYWDPESEPGGLVSTWQPLSFETWLDEGFRGGPPGVTVDAGRVHLQSWVPSNRLAQITVDPRDEAGRMQAGRHRVVITWKVGLVATVFVTVGHDGTTELVAG